MGMQVYKPSCVRFSPSADVLVAGWSTFPLFQFAIMRRESAVFTCNQTFPGTHT